MGKFSEELRVIITLQIQSNVKVPSIFVDYNGIVHYFWLYSHQGLLSRSFVSFTCGNQKKMTQILERQQVDIAPRSAIAHIAIFKVFGETLHFTAVDKMKAKSQTKFKSIL